MNELPKNPNTRQPYSDVALELDRHVGNVVEFLGVSKEEMGPADWSNLQVHIKRLDQAMLRARAVLDPTTLSDDDWKQALISSDDASFGDESAVDSGGGTIHGSDIVNPRPWWKFW
jgi:hypothetical protein